MVNTCTVTSRADQKARLLIRSLSGERPAGPVLVTGCSAQTEREALGALGANVIVVPQAEKARILGVAGTLARALEDGSDPLAHLRRALEGSPSGGAEDPFSLVAGSYSFHTRAFLKIQDGCDCRCAYCRVPAARGPSRSLALDEVRRRAVELEGQGRREIVLTGVNIGAWTSGGTGLPGLLGLLLEASRSVRFRLSSLEPERLTSELADVLSHPRICAHFHVPLQSGSDAVLSRMRRRYVSETVRDGVRRLRAAKDDPFVAADVIAGYPGESAEDHVRTLDLVRDCGFAALHVFRFSPRPSTEAATLRPVVPERLRRERAAELSVLSRELTAAYVRRWSGREVEVLVQSRTAAQCQGVSGNYLRVQAAGPLPENVAPGSLIRCVIRQDAPVLTSGLVAAQFLSLEE